MSAKDNGGAAFPSPGVVLDSHKSERQQGAYGGMTLRDYFAAKAMQGAMAEFANMPVDEAQEKNGYLAAMAYTVADAMLAERAK